MGICPILVKISTAIALWLETKNIKKTITLAIAHSMLEEKNNTSSEYQYRPIVQVAVSVLNKKKFKHSYATYFYNSVYYYCVYTANSVLPIVHMVSAIQVA